MAVKKYISAPLCSALIIPGLGQIINQDIKKGLVLLAADFVLLILGAVMLFLVLNTAFQGASAQGLTTHVLFQHIRSSDFTGIIVVALLFLLTWVYAVVDAFVRGWQIETAGEKSGS